MVPVLRIEDLSKTMAEGGRTLFSDLSADIGAGEVAAVLGASGRGKSTLLRLLARLDAPDGGSLALHGLPAENWSVREWRMKVGYVAQQAVMFPGKVGDNLRAAARIHKQAFDEPLARGLVRQLALDGLDWDKSAGELSGGEKQRLALIRSLLVKPDVLLLDEVTSSLDDASKRAAEAALLRWRDERGASLVWVTHDLAQARRHADRVFYFGEDGRIAVSSAKSFFDGSRAGSAEARLD